MFHQSVGHGTTIRYWDYTIDRLEVMAQKAKNMLPKILNEWLCNVQLYLWVCIFKISRKLFQISLSLSGSRLKAVFGYPHPVAKCKPTSAGCWVSNWQTRWWSSLLDMVDNCVLKHLIFVFGLLESISNGIVGLHLWWCWLMVAHIEVCCMICKVSVKSARFNWFVLPNLVVGLCDWYSSRIWASAKRKII